MVRAILSQFLCEYRFVGCRFHSRELVELVDLIEGHYGSVTGSLCFTGLILYVHVQCCLPVVSVQSLIKISGLNTKLKEREGMKCT